MKRTILSKRTILWSVSKRIFLGTVKAVAYVAAYGNMMAYSMVSSVNAFGELMFVYGAIAAFMTVWAIIVVKETDNMSLVEIENSFRRVKNCFGAENEIRASKDSGLGTPELSESAPMLKD